MFLDLLLLWMRTPMKTNDSLLLVGANGFIGSAIAKYLLSKQIAYYSWDRHTHDLCNLRQTKSYMKQFKGATLRVIYLSSVTRTKMDSSDSMQANISMIDNFIKASKELKIASIIFLSSIDVYDNTEQKFLTEDSELNPNSFYAISKICSENMLQSAFRNSHLTIFRSPGVYGSGDKYDSIIGKFSKLIANRKSVRLFHNGNQLRDYLFVNDLAEIVGHFVKNPTSGIFNLSTGQSLRLSSIIKLISKFLGVEAKVHNIECSHSRDDLRIVNKKLLSYMPRVSLTSMTVGIKNYINENFGK